MNSSDPKPFRIVHYVNQFFGQIGGEEYADTGLTLKEGPVGLGKAIDAALKGQGEIVGTVIAGDNYMAENDRERAREAAEAMVAFTPDILIAGPAFGSGRYGLACGAVCEAAAELMGIPAVSGMHEENPGTALFRSKACIVPTGSNASSMKAAIPAIASVVLAFGKGEVPETGTYFSQGRRTLVERERSGAERAVEMLVARLQGSDNATELPLPSFEQVEASAPLASLAESIIVLVTEGGLTPKGNPDRIEMSMATRYGTYEISGVQAFSSKSYDVAHGGYDNTAARQNPNRLVPLDALRALENEGLLQIGEVMYTTAGNATSVTNAERFGSAIAQDIGRRFANARVGAVMSST